jgi:hypothetical protein
MLLIWVCVLNALSAFSRGITSAQLIHVLAVDHLATLAFSDPREPLLTLLPRCRSLKKLTLMDFTNITDQVP